MARGGAGPDSLALSASSLSPGEWPLRRRFFLSWTEQSKLSSRQLVQGTPALSTSQRTLRDRQLEQAFEARRFLEDEGDGGAMCRDGCSMMPTIERVLGAATRRDCEAMRGEQLEFSSLEKSRGGTLVGVRNRTELGSRIESRHLLP